jgi:hypothetical protein
MLLASSGVAEARSQRLASDIIMATVLGADARVPPQPPATPGICAMLRSFNLRGFC